MLNAPLANINPITDETRMLKKYWEAIYHFRNDKFVDCSSLMSEIKHTSKNFVLKHLAAFMEARCLFWDTRTNWELLTKEDKNRVVKTLEEYSKQVSFITSLKTDIDFYIHEILSWSENYNIEN